MVAKISITAFKVVLDVSKNWQEQILIVLLKETENSWNYLLYTTTLRKVRDFVRQLFQIRSGKL